MSKKALRLRTARATQIECLEERIVMTAQALDALITQHNGVGFDAIDQHIEVAPHQEDSLQEGGYWQQDDLELPLGQEFERVEQTLNSAHALTGLDEVLAHYGFTGDGQTVAVIDSGIAWSHEALGGGLGKDYRVVGGWDFTENDADPYDDGPNGGHGTHVAGIVGADGLLDGVASGVDLVGLRVFDDSGYGHFGYVEQALQWVIANHDNSAIVNHPITAINLSLGMSWNDDVGEIPFASIEDEFAQLESMGIFISVSAGNSFTSYNAQGLSYPAASQYVTPVMSVDDNGSLSYFSQRHTSAIAAPGRTVTSTVPDYAANDADNIDDDWASMSGTSMASPYVAGASVIIRQAMEFAGYENITQDTIYDHIVSTADQFYDSATNATYNRLNLWSAIDALMPADDYGSSIDTAYSLGVLSDGLQANAGTMDGAITALDDSDYFTFTAGVTGEVTFTVGAASHELQAAWQGWDGSGAVGDGAVGDNGASYTLQVQQGQTYTVALATADGLGYYDFTIDVESTFEFVDWGATGRQDTHAGVAVDGEQWFRVTAGQAGYVTAQALVTSGAATVELYDANLQSLDDDGARSETYAQQGDEIYIRVTGAATLDVRLTNAVSMSGGVATVTGTSGDDALTFTAGDTTHTVSLNGVSYNVSATSIQINGGAGSDSLLAHGSAASETALVGVNSVSLTSSGYGLHVRGVEENVLVGGGGNDTAYMYGSSGADTYRSYGDRAVMSGSGYYNRASGFDSTTGFANGAEDIAYMYGSSGDDLYRSYSDRVVMSGAGFVNRAFGFSSTVGYGDSANDIAQMFDSAGADEYRTSETHAIMAGQGYHNTAVRFGATYGFASGPSDMAWMYGSSGDDVYSTSAERVVMQGAGYANTASGFGATVGYANGENDRVYMRGSDGDDLYRAYSDRVVMSGADYLNRAYSFDQTWAYGDSAGDIAQLHGTPEDEEYRTSATHAVMSGTGYINTAAYFSSTFGHGGGGGDQAWMYGSEAADTYVAYADYVRMSSVSYSNTASDFASTYGYANGAGDRAELYGTEASDSFRAYTDRSILSGAGYYSRATGFDIVVGSGEGGADTAWMYDESGDDLATVRDEAVSFALGSGRRLESQDFEEVYIHGTGGSNAVDETAVDYYFERVGNWV
ncbi:Subtilisin DY [Pseudobythopirellula maris]|uniref:Subtilisin DY n=1 Tax=Pseudobythopirellula maris TaxID=2527991 RepID=A0A5C5ZI88_9BACT|nr:S8 family serine peptidase [Pseudobythopirellula maris]TWT87092.1 Subtilisin DY [Pseudobythopirellula maris]